MGPSRRPRGRRGARRRGRRRRVLRLFSDDDHGHGYVDAETPEVAVAVRDGRRGEGIGTRLLAALAELARERGVDRLSLSVDAANPARRLYARLGYRELSEDESGVRMLIELR
jgi:GNAT superfamily N-acetyltransferase